MGDAELDPVALPLKGAVIGVLVAGVVGAIAGLAIGLHAYVPTALFAMFEVGIPSAMLGGLIGFLAGSIAAGVRWIRR